jgi:hypothetical protein
LPGPAVPAAIKGGNAKMSEEIKKFQRIGRGSPAETDIVGTIQILLRCVDQRGRSVKHNVTRSIRVSEARVSEVAQAIENALF